MRCLATQLFVSVYTCSPLTITLRTLEPSSSSSCSPVNLMVTMSLKYDVSILVCHVRCPSLPSCSVVNDSSPLVYYWSTSCMEPAGSVFTPLGGTCLSTSCCAGASRICCRTWKCFRVSCRLRLRSWWWWWWWGYWCLNLFIPQLLQLPGSLDLTCTAVILYSTTDHNLK